MDTKQFEKNIGKTIRFRPPPTYRGEKLGDDRNHLKAVQVMDGNLEFSGVALEGIGNSNGLSPVKSV